MESPGVSLKKQVEHEIYEYIIEIIASIEKSKF